MIRRKSSHRHYPNPKGPPTPHFVAPRVNELTLGKPERYRSGFGARQHTVERTPVLDPSGREVGDIQRRFTKNRAIDTATSHYATRVGVQGANLAWLGRQKAAHQSGDWERTTGTNVEETFHHVVADFNELDDLIAHAHTVSAQTQTVQAPRGPRYSAHQSEDNAQDFKIVTDFPEINSAAESKASRSLMLRYSNTNHCCDRERASVYTEVTRPG